MKCHSIQYLIQVDCKTKRILESWWFNIMSCKMRIEARNCVKTKNIIACPNIVDSIIHVRENKKSIKKTFHEFCSLQNEAHVLSRDSSHFVLIQIHVSIWQKQTNWVARLPCCFHNWVFICMPSWFIIAENLSEQNIAFRYRDF